MNSALGFGQTLLFDPRLYGVSAAQLVHEMEIRRILAPPGAPHPAAPRVEPRAEGVPGAVSVLFALVLPPLSVALTAGVGGQFWLNILLTLFGYAPGVLHAIWVIARK